MTSHHLPILLVFPHGLRGRKNPTFGNLDNFSALDAEIYSAFIAVQDSYPIHSTSDPPILEYLSCAASTDAGVLHFGAMLKDPDRPLFEQDMIREVSDLLHTKTVEITPHSSIPADFSALPSIWSFRQKRAPDWTILKHKARLCPHGGKKVKGKHFWARYSPVINWCAVHLVLILSLLADFKSRQIDYGMPSHRPLHTLIFL
jgi:hypothetical protein